MRRRTSCSYLDTRGYDIISMSATTHACAFASHPSRDSLRAAAIPDQIENGLNRCCKHLLTFPPSRRVQKCPEDSKNGERTSDSGSWVQGQARMGES